MGRMDRLGYNEGIESFRDSHSTIVFYITCSTATELQRTTLASKRKTKVCLHRDASRHDIEEYSCEMVKTWTELCQMYLAELHIVVFTHGRGQHSW